MANNKLGFDYYQADTDRHLDIKLKKLKKNFGCNGYAVYEYILSEIFRVKGCFIMWDESTAFDVADYWGLKENLVNEIVNYCCTVGLFNKALLTSESVLTSFTIQSRYLEMCKKAKRQNVKIPEKYVILPEECGKLHEESSQNSVILPHSKVEYSKEEESIGMCDPEFEKTILGFWDLGEIRHFQSFKLFRQAYRLFDLTGQFEHFKSQCLNYKAYTEKNGLKYKKSFDKFLGDPKKGFEDGTWNAENWESRLKLLNAETDKSNGAQQGEKVKYTEPVKRTANQGYGR